MNHSFTSIEKLCGANCSERDFSTSNIISSPVWPNFLNSQIRKEFLPGLVQPNFGPVLNNSSGSNFGSERDFGVTINSNLDYLIQRMISIDKSH